MRCPAVTPACIRPPGVPAHSPAVSWTGNWPGAPRISSCMEINEPYQLGRNGPALLRHTKHISPLSHRLAFLASSNQSPFPAYFYPPARLYLPDYARRHLLRPLLLHRLRAYWRHLPPQSIDDLARLYPE